MDNFFKYIDNDINVNYLRDENPNKHNFKMHTHENFELYYFFGGNGCFKVEGNPYHLESGDVLIISPKESHYIDIESGTPYTRLAVHFDKKLFEAIDINGKLTAPFLEHEIGHFNRYKNADFETNDYMHYIHNLIKPAEDRRLQIVSNLLPLLNEISIAYKTKKDDSQNNSLDYQIIRYINYNLFNQITLDSLCKEFYISKPQLCRIFKAATGSTVWDYITVKRLVAARTLIEDGQSPTTAATECGFNDYSAFYRAYKKKYGTSPSEA